MNKPPKSPRREPEPWTAPPIEPMTENEEMRRAKILAARCVFHMTRLGEVRNNTEAVRMWKGFSEGQLDDLALMAVQLERKADAKFGVSPFAETLDAMMGGAR